MLAGVRRARARPAAVFPASALDYGCGLGRILIPLGDSVCERVIGVRSPNDARPRSSQSRHGPIFPMSSCAQANQVPPIASPIQFAHSALVLQNMFIRPGAWRLSRSSSACWRPGRLAGAFEFHQGQQQPSTPTVPASTRNARQVASNLLVRVRGGDSREALVLMHPDDSTSVLRVPPRGGCSVAVDRSTTQWPHRCADVLFQKSRSVPAHRLAARSPQGAEGLPRRLGPGALVMTERARPWSGDPGGGPGAAISASRSGKEHPGVTEIVIAGLSLSGLAAVYAATRHPAGVPGGVLPSPSFWWERGGSRRTAAGDAGRPGVLDLCGEPGRPGPGCRTRRRGCGKG